MRPGHLFLVSSIVFLGTECDPAVAQTPMVEGKAIDAAAYINPWSVDLILGLPTGLRIQHALDESRVWHAEGFVGTELIFPVVGGGLRWHTRPWCGERNCVTICPGADLYLLYNSWRKSGSLFSGGPEYAGLLAADVDISWQHVFGERWGGEMGLKLGAGAVFAHSWAPVPVIGVFAGFQF